MTDRKIIDDALNAFDLVTLVGEHVELRPKVGGDMQGLCPFHRESTPSFVVNKTRYHCFGCGQHGDAITWLMNKEGMTFPGALEHLGVNIKAAWSHKFAQLPAVDMEARVIRCRSVLPYKYLIKALIHSKLGALGEKVFLSILPREHEDELKLICDIYGVSFYDYMGRAEALNIWESMVEKWGKTNFSLGLNPS